ncbi:hypothetical protein [Bacillus toyonensis]|uniref:hypothetical protein n=1 Tax=Bacillus toyonensis TaxID=155322 RepID=UPI000BF36829|nr:hypothetical protein [Bacillus toyonensis]PGF05201.1 hypothetical protein COM61_01915 [Bacillus toyonensis]
MKQPKINIQGKIYKVLELGFHSKTGELDKVLFQIKEHNNCHVFKKDTMVNDKLTENIPITETTRHPYHDYYHAPDLESLLIYNDDAIVKTFTEKSLVALSTHIQTGVGVKLSELELKEVVKELPLEIVNKGTELEDVYSKASYVLYTWICENKDLIKSKKSFDKGYLDSIREVTLQATSVYLTEEQTKEVAYILPSEIEDLVAIKGNQDESILEQIYQWVDTNMDKINEILEK